MAVPMLTSLALQTVTTAAIVCAEDGAIVYANRIAATMFAYASDELVGQPLSVILPEVRLTALARPLAASNPQPIRRPEVTTTGFGIRKDGVGVPVEIKLQLQVKDGSRYFVVSLTDITERLHLEERLSTATTDLGFERLIADIAVRLADTAPQSLDEAIVASLTQIANMLQLDRAILWRWRIGDSSVIPFLYSVDTPQSPPAVTAIASFPYIMSKLQAGETVSFTGPDDLPDPIDRDSLQRLGSRSGIALPVAHVGEEGIRCALWFSSIRSERTWVPAISERLRLVAAVIGQALAHRASQAALQKVLDELQHLRSRPSAAVESRHDVKQVGASRLIVSESAVVRHALAQLEQVAATPATVLLLGETGTGKELFAQAIHDSSPRHRRPMVVVSCAAIPSALIESELFGRERGAYTGALSRQIGRFEAANQSTLFLDEIGELPPEMQIKLLRVVQERVIERLGSTQPIKVDVRIIAATHRDLEQAVRDGDFREDLFYRLNVFPIVVPPLRDRIDDIPGLVWSFVDEFSRTFGKTINSVSMESMRELQNYPWPGNVRELRNVIERAVILANSHQLTASIPTFAGRTMPQSALTLSAIEVEHIRAVLESTNWRVRGSGGAAERLGLKPTTLESRMARLGIARKKTP